MKKLVKLLTAGIAVVMVASFGLTACGKKDPDTSAGGSKDNRHTYNTYVTVTPSTWNELDSTDENNDAIMSYIRSAFFEYDFKFEDGKKYNADGSLNLDGIVDGAFEVKYSAATALEDVTAKYGKEWGLSDAQIAAGGYAWQITLREDLKWDDGTPIKAEDFVYTMKQQLSPEYKFARSDSYYANAVKIKNAKNYVYQGSSGLFDVAGGFTREDLVKQEDGSYLLGGSECKFVLKDSLSWTSGYTLAFLMENGYRDTYLDGASYDALLKLADDSGRVAVTDESIALMETLITKYADWDETTEEIVQYIYYNFTWPEVDFNDVGIFNDGDYNIVLVCDNPMSFFKEDGSLSYLAAYNFSSLPLVKKSLFEAYSKKSDDGLTSTYCTSFNTSASWGPYKLTYFQAGKQFILEKNDNWYGYNMEDNKGMYQTDRIVYEVIAEEEAKQLAFWQGEVDSLGISVTIAPDYKNSKYAVYSPRIAVFAVNIFSDLDTLKAGDRNNGVLAIKDFREAMSLTLDRDEYNQKLTTANKTCLGFMGEDYYYDIANAATLDDSGVYRYTEQAKSALLRTYGFTLGEDGKWSDGSKSYATMDDALDAMTGLNSVVAKQKLESAYKELTENAEKYGYDSSKKIQICLGDSVDDASSQRAYSFIKEWLEKMVEGTSFEGKIEVNYNFTFGDTIFDAFNEGLCDISTTGIGNAPFDPFYFVGAWINMSSSVATHPYWEVDKDVLTYKLPEGDYCEDAGKEVALTVADWYNSLNGNLSAEPTYDLSTAPTEIRLEILAMLEEYGLKQYNSLPTSRGFTAALHSAKWHYATDTYNTMLGFGGIAYMQYDYTDAEWEIFVQEHNGNLSEFYKSAE